MAVAYRWLNKAARLAALISKEDWFAAVEVAKSWENDWTCGPVIKKLKSRLNITKRTPGFPCACPCAFLPRRIPPPAARQEGAQANQGNPGGCFAMFIREDLLYNPAWSEKRPEKDSGKRSRKGKGKGWHK